MADSVLVVRRHVDSWQVISCYLEERHSLEECQAAALRRNSEAEAARCGGYLYSSLNSGGHSVGSQVLDTR